MIRMLESNGFWVARIGRRHDLWTNGYTKITLSRGSKTKYRLINLLRVTIRRGVELKRQAATAAQSKARA